MSLGAKQVLGILMSVKKSLEKKIDDTVVHMYTPGGSLTFDELPQLSAEFLGYAYVVTDDFTTDSRFVEGVGEQYPGGTTVAVVDTGTAGSPVYKFDATVGAITVDEELDTDSKNPVENRVVSNKFEDVDDFMSDTLSSLADLSDFKYDTETDIYNMKGDIQDLESGKQDNLTFDDTPTEYSDNPVTSDGIYTAIQSVLSDISDLDNELSGDIDTKFDSASVAVDYNPADTYNPGDYCTHGDGLLYLCTAQTTGEFDSQAWTSMGVTIIGLIQAIQALIPSNASSSNKFATAAEITTLTNSKISTSNTPGHVMNDGTIDQTQYEESGVAETLVKDTVGWSGKNLCSELERGAFDNNGLNQDGTNRIRNKYYIPVVANKSYTIKASSSKPLKFSCSFYNKDDYETPRISNVPFSNTSLTFTVPTGAKFIRSVIGYTDDSNIKLDDISDAQIEEGTEATSFEPYHATVDTVKADKVTNATSGHLAGLDSNGNLTDSGVSPTEDVTVEGNPVTFESPFEQDAKNVVVSVKPIQDLHGYDHPWVGGAGKNLYGGESNVIFDLPRVISANSNCELSFTREGGGNVTINLYRAGETSRYDYFTTGGDRRNFTVTEDTARIMLGVPNGTTITNVQLELGSSVTSYEPYSNICPISGIDEVEIEVSDGESEPTTTTIPLPSTLYDADVDVTEGSADSRKGFVDLGDLEWEYDSTYNYFKVLWDDKNAYKPAQDVEPTFINDVYTPTNTIAARATMTNKPDKCITYHVPSDGFYLCIKDLSYNNATAFKTAMSGHQLCYELATPTTISLTPTDVELLEGTNVVTTNGEKVAVTYGRSLWQDINDLKTDTEGKLDKSDVADVEGDTASKAYSVNDFMLRSDGFYKVTQPIAQNASITASNTTKTTIGAVLTALLNA